MYCPQCRSEYRPGFSECADCEVPLVETLAEERLPVPGPPLVTVLAEGDPGRLALAESLLLAEEIPYVKTGEHLQDLLSGSFGTGLDPVAGPILIQVPEDHAAAAAEILETLRSAERTGPGLKPVVSFFV